jgi:hypothetical protein
MSVIGAGRWHLLDRYWASSPSSTACSPPPTNRPNIISFSAMSPAAPRGPLVRRAFTRLREPRPSSRRPGRDLHQSGPPPALWSCLAMSRATLPGSLWTPYLLLSAATAAASVGELDEEPCEATRRDDLQQLGPTRSLIDECDRRDRPRKRRWVCFWGTPCPSGRETSSLSHRIAPRGAISMAATPRAKSATSRSPCLVRSSPESSARFEMTCSTTWSVSIVSGSSYVTSM